MARHNASTIIKQFLLVLILGCIFAGCQESDVYQFKGFVSYKNDPKSKTTKPVEIKFKNVCNGLLSKGFNMISNKENKQRYTKIYEGNFLHVKKVKVVIQYLDYVTPQKDMPELLIEFSAPDNRNPETINANNNFIDMLGTWLDKCSLQEFPNQI